MCGSYQEISERPVTVRKPRICEWCGERVEVGAKAWLRVYKFDGDFNSNHTHPECYEAMRKADYHDLCDGWNRGDWKRGTNEARE